MRVGWQNLRSAPICMGMVNCNYIVYAPLGWSNRMNWMDLICPAESGPKGTSSKFVKLTYSIYVICSPSTVGR
jgi:hypothetical protein